MRQLLNQIAQIAPGNDAKLKILRKDKELELTVQTGKRPKPKKDDAIKANYICGDGYGLNPPKF